MLGYCWFPELNDDFDKDISIIKMEIFPNPGNHTIQIKNLEPGSSVSIFNLPGTKILEIENGNAETPIDISALAAGIYTAVINGRETVRFIKE